MTSVFVVPAMDACRGRVSWHDGFISNDLWSHEPLSRGWAVLRSSPCCMLSIMLCQSMPFHYLKWLSTTSSTCCTHAELVSDTGNPASVKLLPALAGHGGQASMGAAGYAGAWRRAALKSLNWRTREQGHLNLHKARLVVAWADMMYGNDGLNSAVSISNSICGTAKHFGRQKCKGGHGCLIWWPLQSAPSRNSQIKVS